MAPRREGPSKWSRVSREALEVMRLEEQAKLKPYRATVHLTILAKDKRDAKRALRSVGAFGAKVRVERTEGPDEIQIGGDA